MSVELHLADCREVMRSMPSNSVDSVITDTPYEIGFMGAKWDSTGIAFDRTVWTEARRVLKPGGYVLAFGATRTWHWLACALELSGFESRGSIAWIQGQGMQHGRDISKAMDADQGAEREVVGVDDRGRERTSGRGQWGGVQLGGAVDITAPATDDAREWAGWGTQLAPKHEPIAMFRKPLEGTYVENIRQHGVGGLNIDGCRLATSDDLNGGAYSGERRDRDRVVASAGLARGIGEYEQPSGRWPPNVALDEAAAAQLDAMVGKRKSSGIYSPGEGKEGGRVTSFHGAAQPSVMRDDDGGPSRFFYCPKAATGERDRGCEHLRWVRDGSEWRLCEGTEAPELVGNPWPTVKPLELMRWLVRLVTPKGGVVLDPFLGSGTTGVSAVCEGMSFVGCDSSPFAIMIASARIRWAQGLGPSVADLPKSARSQTSLFA